MAKLPKAVAKRVNEAETSSFEAIPDGVYVAVLKEVDPSKSGKAGPYWSWVFEIQDESAKGRLMWVNTSLAATADWKMKEVFSAFGYDADTDTDELVGQKIKLSVSQRIIEAGARKGEMGNNVERCLPLGDAGGDGDDAEDVF